MPVEDKRGAILQAMMELVKEKGFHGTAMSMVAKQAGVAAGTIYHYFESKDEVINELYAEISQRLGSALAEEEGVKGTIKDRFFRLYFNLYHYFIGHIDEFRFMEQYTSSPYSSASAREASQQALRPLSLFLEQGIALGVLRPMELSLMMALVYGHVVAMAKLHLSYLQHNLSTGQSSPGQHLEQAAQSCWDGVRIN